MLCVHCHKGKVSRPGGLCWACYYTPSVRQQYVVRTRCGRRGLGGRPGRKPALEPTDALPGSEEKIRVLMKRAERGQELWHPHDATFAGPWRFGRAG